MKKNPFELPKTFGLTDFVSLRDNHMNAVILQVHKKQAISLPLGRTVVYDLDPEGDKILLVMNVGDDNPLIIYASQLEVLPSRSMEEWRRSNENWLFCNPDSPVNELIPKTQFPDPNGRVYIRTLPKVLEQEGPDNLPKLFAGPMQGDGIPASKRFVGTVTLYEATDEEPHEKFVVLINSMNLAVPETGGLMKFFVGRSINPNEIE